MFQRIEVRDFYAQQSELDNFLDEIYKIKDMKISIKTRLGKKVQKNFMNLIEIYNKYPLEELIIHPRTRKIFMGIHLILNVLKDTDIFK